MVDHGIPWSSDHHFRLGRPADLRLCFLMARFIYRESNNLYKEFNCSDFVLLQALIKKIYFVESICFSFCWTVKNLVNLD